MVDGLPLPAGFPLGSQGQNSEKSETPLRLGKNPEQVQPLPPPPTPQLCGSVSREVGGSVQGKEWREAAHSNYVFLELLQAKPLTFISKNGSF